MTLKQGLLRLTTAVLLLTGISSAQEYTMVDTFYVKGLKQIVERTGIRDSGFVRKTSFYSTTSIVEESEIKGGVTRKLLTYNVGDSTSYVITRMYDEKGQRQRLEFVIEDELVQIQDYDVGLEQDTISAEIYKHGTLFCIRQKVQDKKRNILEESCDLNLDGIMDVKRVLTYLDSRVSVETINYLTDYGSSQGYVFKNIDPVYDWQVFRH